MCGSVPEIFAIKVESCQKSRRIMDVFSPSIISGGRPSKRYTHFITPTSRHVAWKSFCEDTPISPEVLVAHTLNFKPNFKFSRLKNFLGTPVPVVVCASKVWSICNACRNLRRQHPPRPNCSLPKNFRLGGSIWATKTFLFMDQSSPNFFSPNVEGVVVDKILFGFAMYASVLEIFAIKVESCQKSRKILEVFFALPNFRGPAFQKLCPFYHPYLTARRMEKVLWEYSH